MLEARIVSPRGSLYFAAEATPYDLETLRLHLRAFTPKAADVQMQVRVDEADAIVPALSAWLQQLADAGVQVTRSPATHVGEIADGLVSDLVICAGETDRLVEPLARPDRAIS